MRYACARRCEFWVWCSHKAGCDDKGEFSGHYPYHGCQLMQLPSNVMPQNWNRGPVFSSFESGYVTGEPLCPALLALSLQNAASYSLDQIFNFPSSSTPLRNGFGSYACMPLYQPRCIGICLARASHYRPVACHAKKLLPAVEQSQTIWENHAEL